MRELCLRMEGSTQLKLVLVTTDGQLESHAHIREFLEENHLRKRVRIDFFEEPSYFSQILLPKFPYDEALQQRIESIFTICKGSPERLKKLLSNLLYEKNGIDFIRDDHSAYVNSDVLDTYLINENSEFDPSLLSDSQVFYLQLLLLLRIPISCKLFDKIVRSVMKCISGVSSFDLIGYNHDLMQLCNAHIVKKSDGKLSLFHDSLIIPLKKHFEQSPLNELLADALSQFLEIQKDACIEHGISEQDRFYLLAINSFVGSSPEWEQINYKYAVESMSRENFVEATRAFERLLEKGALLDTHCLLQAGQCFYQCGRYSIAENVSRRIEPSKLQVHDLFDYYYLLGCIAFVTKSSEEAEPFLRKARKVANVDRDRLRAFTMHLHTLRESSENGYKKASNMFKRSASFIEAHCFPPAELSVFLRNSAFYDDIELIKKRCNKAVSLAHEVGNPALEAYALCSEAFGCMKADDLKLAEAMLLKAKMLLTDTLPHENAYVLNNLAICKMLQGCWESAFSMISEGLFWSASPYIKLCLQTHLVMCSLYCGEYDIATETSAALESYLDNEQLSDPVIQRRIRMNLCIYYQKLNDEEKAQRLFKYLDEVPENSLSRYRYRYLNTLLVKQKSLTSSSSLSRLESSLAFDPWVVIFSHD